VTDGVLGLGIGLEPAERGTMLRPPQRPTDGILARGLGLQIVWQGLLLGAVNLAVAIWAYHTWQAQWQTVVMTTVVLLQVFQAQASRSSEDSVFDVNPLSNPGLLATTGIIFALQASVVFIPQLHGIFATTSLTALQTAVPFAAGLIVLLVVAAVKRIVRRT
jgi:Ca2+-transporting ATPase